MRALREQPRVTFAKTLVVVALVATSTVVGALLDGEGDDPVQVTQARLASAQHSLTGMELELGVAHERIARAEMVFGRARQDARVLARANRRLRSELRAARRAGRQARQQR